MNGKFYKIIGIVFGILLLGIIVMLFLGVKGQKDMEKEMTKDVQTEGDLEEELGKELQDIEGNEVLVTEEEKEHHDFLEGYKLTEEEDKTILKNRTEQIVEPFEHKNRLYVFYDRDKAGSGVLIDVVEEFVEETDVPYTIYHMNSEEGLVNGTVVLERMGYEYDYQDEDGIVLVQIKDKEIVTMMTPSTFSENDLKR